MAATQKDIARESGVAQSVVSDVLQGRIGRRVSGETRQRILHTARALGYRANVSAQALRTQRTGQVAYLTTRADAWYVLHETKMIGVATALAERKFRLLIEVADAPADAPGVLQELFAAGVCDGCVIRTLQSPDWDWAAVKQLEKPVVVVGNCADSAMTSVALDTPFRVRLALERLAERGHRRIGLMTTGYERTFFTTIQRIWEETAPTYGFDPKRWVGAATTRSEGDVLATCWLSSADGPTAILCLSEPATVGVTRAALRAHRAFGDGFDLVGFTVDAASTWLYEPGTWYFDISREARGQRAAQELLCLLDSHPASGPIRLRPNLVQIAEAHP